MGKETQDSSKTTVPIPPCAVDGPGTNAFSNKGMYASILVVPLLASLLLNVSLWYYPVLLLILGLPTFAAFNMATIYWLSSVPLAGLPNASASSYNTFLDPALKAAYASGKSKIPMETWFEAYFDGKLDINQDMLTMIETRYDWASFTFTLSQLKFFITQWIPETLWHSKIQDQDQVREHYDRGDDFYEAFLGPMMIYTSGIIKDTSRFETLEELQTAKLERVAEKIHLKKGDKMLDIGCGWGTLSVHGAKMGADVTGVTLGLNQHEWAMGKAREAGVEDRVKILCMDYRDIPEVKYDKITCLEMAEHVGVLRFHDFLMQVKGLLKDDGLFFLQIAGLRRAWQYEDLAWGLFMAKYVFPGADASPPLNWVIEQLERAGFEVSSSETVGVHYSATIYRWYLNWMGNKEMIVEKYGKSWFRKWEVFLAWSTVVARQGGATCYQIVAHKNSNDFDRTIFAGGSKGVGILK